MDSYEQVAGSDREPTGAVPRLNIAPTLTTPTGPYVTAIKPLLDRVGGVVLTLLTVPVALLVALAIWSTMGRPAVFVQERVGRNGKVFRIYKFRTMHPDRRNGGDRRAGERAGTPDRRLSHKTREDPRVTRLGAALRKWSLDEIPQLWNVALGQMSLVGPRPELVSIVEGYEGWQHLRHVVKPGITGIWQVSARGDVPMHEATQLDIDYVTQVSFLTDVRILFLTLPAALGIRRGF